MNPEIPHDEGSVAPTRHSLMTSALDDIDKEIARVMSCLREVLISCSRAEMAESLPWLGDSSKDEVSLDPASTAQIYSISFQLLDMIEEQVALKTRRGRERLLGPDAEKGLWPWVFHSLKKSDFTGEQISEVLKQVRVEPVFTAHPTEAKRPSVRERHRDLYEQLSRLQNPTYSPQECERAQSDLLASLEALWMTREIHAEKPTIEKELRNVLFYLREAFPQALEHLDRHLCWAWKHAGFDSDLLESFSAGPAIRFGLWIGGDRDGHPFVTSEVTEQTLQELRRQALKLYRQELADAADHLSVSTPSDAVPKAIGDRIDALVTQLGDYGKAIKARNPEEPWRCFAYLLRANLKSNQGSSKEEFENDLYLLRDSLEEIGAGRLADQFVGPLLRKLEVFGFHLAELDIRQNSDFHDRGAAQLLAAAGVKDGESFAEWSEDKRVEFLTKELNSPRPFFHFDQSIGKEADDIRSCYRVLHNYRTAHGDGIGALIVSMTRSLSDLLLVHLFARESGLTEGHEGDQVCPLQVVPLFETLDDLDNGAGIVNAYLDHPAVKKSLGRVCAGERSVSQQVMLGYSDSNKDGGILASQWALHSSQNEIAEIGRNHEVEIRFFHGRGGTISRGAGPTNWFMRALPGGSLGGDFRMTEQGETIAKKYAFPENASYHMESLAACVTYTAAMHRHKKVPVDPAIDLIPRLAETSSATYRKLLETDGFIEFFRQATPIDALEQNQMGSRPSRRTGTASLDDLRAIPWVFSWTQARFYLSGWYGVGSALEALQKESSKDYERLCELTATSTLTKYIFTNVETNLISANRELMQAYASLVTDKKLQKRFMDHVEKEYDLTTKHLANLFPTPIEERRPRYAKTLEIREAPLKTLHLQQVDLLRSWRKTGGDLPDDLILSISAIASGLRTTG